MKCQHHDTVSAEPGPAGCLTHSFQGRKDNQGNVVKEDGEGDSEGRGGGGVPWVRKTGVLEVRVGKGVLGVGM